MPKTKDWSTRVTAENGKIKTYVIRSADGGVVIARNKDTPKTERIRVSEMLIGESQRSAAKSLSKARSMAASAMTQPGKTSRVSAVKKVS